MAAFLADKTGDFELDGNPYQGVAQHGFPLTFRHSIIGEFGTFGNVSNDFEITPDFMSELAGAPSVAASIPAVKESAVFTIGNQTVLVDGQPYQMDVPRTSTRTAGR